MRSLSLVIILALTVALLSLRFTSPSPHGKDFKRDCALCHNSASWKVEMADIRFDHNTTGFVLEGSHKQTDCKACHQSLIFSEAKSQCASCHTDMHQGTLGADCDACHTPLSWIVEDIIRIHQEGRFPLLGAHRNADCYDCHPSSSLLLFEPLGIQCYDCHQADFLSTRNPAHPEAGFSTECEECHNINAFEWAGSGFGHQFFPLTKGHQINNCFACHTPDQPYAGISSDCYSCHQEDYAQTLNPNHQAINLSIECTDCHTTDPGWKPARFEQHDGLYFPIYSGEHQGEWNSCADCHTNSANYAQFTCIDCHEHNKPDMDDEHDDVGGYIYESQACFECHPQGNAEESFNHNTSNFPLTGAHLTTSCSDCHTNGYQGTTNICSDCHIAAYNATVNPNHLALNIPISCEDCHTTIPDWKPASFAIHNDYYVLQGAHSLIAQDCYTCHQGDYLQTPNTCYGCHSQEYNQTTDPPHATAQFPIDCESCHTQTAWEPSTFNHDGQYFPIYSGKHNGEWNACADCHVNPSNYAVFSCIDCHEHNQQDMDDEHSGVSGYVYNSIACLSCHPDGSDNALPRFNRRMEDKR